MTSLLTPQSMGTKLGEVPGIKTLTRFEEYDVSLVRCQELDHSPSISPTPILQIYDDIYTKDSDYSQSMARTRLLYSGSRYLHPQSLRSVETETTLDLLKGHLPPTNLRSRRNQFQLTLNSGATQPWHHLRPRGNNAF